MKLAYLLNTYPQTSTTFIRREIRGIEAEGEPVTRFAIRRWDKTLVEPTDVEEQAKTEYLLSGNVAGLLVSLLLALATNLPRLIGVLPLWWQVRTAAGDGGVRHIAALRGDAIKGMQVGFLALSAAGEVGAFALMPGFTYAVTDLAGITRVLPATSLT